MITKTSRRISLLVCATWMFASSCEGAKDAQRPILIRATEVNALFEELFPHAPPVRSTQVVSPPRGLLFSIDAIAVATQPPTHPPSAT